MSKELQIPEKWSDAERWAWEEIRAGRIADFHNRYGIELDPEKPDGWDNEQRDRRLSQLFLEAILTDESFCLVTSFRGVRIRGACFEQTVDLQHARLERQLWIEHCRFQGGLILRNLQINGWLSLEGSWLGGAVDLMGALLDSSAFLIQVQIVGHLDVKGATISADLDMRGSGFKEVDLTGAKIGGDLLMNESTFKEIDLSGTKIAGNVVMNDITVDCRLNINGADIGQSLSMHKKASFKEVDLTGARIGGHLEMIGSTFDGNLNMDGTKIGHLLMREKASFKEVKLTAAKIDGYLDMSGSTFKEVDLMGTIVGGSLDMNSSTFKEVSLIGAKIGGDLDMTGSKFDGNLTMNGTEIDHHLFLRTKASFKDVDLTGARIGGQLDMDGSTFDGALTMDTIEIGQSLFARSATFPSDEEVVINFARIGSNFDLSGATIGTIDLTATTITGELRLGSAREHEPTRWVKPSKMVLRNTTVDAIQDADIETKPWPEHLELKGFTYRRLGGFGAEGSADFANRDYKWFINWLESDETFSPQPYEQLANILHESGFPSKANAIRFAARKRSRTAAWERRKDKPREWLRFIGLSFLQYTIGYGLGARYFRVLLWFGGFTLIGFVVLLASINNSNCGLFDMVWASFDQVLPIVKLNADYERFILDNCGRWTIAYFYVQKLIGYVLGGFLGAGLAGLTQKS